MAIRYCNLVFQGGGVRAIAYAGALQSLPSDLRIHIAAGSSAGALIAALLAIGKGPADLKNILEATSFGDFLNEVERTRQRALESLQEDFVKLYRKGERPSAYQLWRLWSKHKATVEEVRKVWDRRGLYSSKKLRSWLDGIFGEFRFENITAVHDLKIVAADVTRQKYHIYSKSNESSTLLAEAVHASISIPVFFEPLHVDKTCFVDGGLLSNFPSFLLSQGVYPTIGFRLGTLRAPHALDNTSDYVNSLLLTMMDAHDKERGTPQYFHDYEIEIPETIPSTKFVLDAKEIGLLYQNGLQTSRKVNWKHHSSSKPVVPYYDPKPQECLQMALTEADKLFQRLDSHENWCESVHSTIQCSAFVDADWSTLYRRETEINITEGDTQLFMRRGRFTPSKGENPSSLMECHFHAEELHANGRKVPLVRIPCINNEDQKGFLIFFAPPIALGRPRTFSDALLVPGEFAKSLAAGREDAISFAFHQCARKQTAEVQFHLYLHESLPELIVDGDFGHEIRFVGIEQHDMSRYSSHNMRTTQKFRHYQSAVVTLSISGTPSIGVKLSPKGDELFADIDEHLPQMGLFTDVNTR